MSLTRGGGPLAPDASTRVNYHIDSPERCLYLHQFPRRVRAEFGGRTVVDSRQGFLLHESNLLPVFYFPWDDIAESLLVATEHTTHCPFKGEASYWTLRVGDAVAHNAVWSYLDPVPAARWLRGLAAMYWSAAHAWYDEEEKVHAHLRDPFHRVDVRQSSDIVRVSLGEEVVAVSSYPKVLSETGLPNRYYLPPEGIHSDLLVPSRTRTRCPYKGEASYWNVRVGERELADAAWSYNHPLKDAHDVREYVCFNHDELTIAREEQP
ncbi:DUF427 domain-containing protein [Salinactinospora qingdaonensis]|uniref:DUF427 domain-containing protein n=1 Tax=Salinactinospora qingdaonensis TaxID=702744 RepID=A0ABP7EW01_9ACTN